MSKRRKKPIAMEELRWKLPSGFAVLFVPMKLIRKDFVALRRAVDLLEMASGEEEAAKS